MCINPLYMPYIRICILSPFVYHRVRVFTPSFIYMHTHPRLCLIRTGGGAVSEAAGAGVAGAAEADDPAAGVY
jgi:hypothetical protein